MSSVSNPIRRPSSQPDPNHGPSKPVRMWARLPAVAQAVLVGLVVLVAGNFLPQGLFLANFKSPAVPWSAVLIGAWLWLHWQYVSGRGWPRSTSASRRRDLRAAPLSPHIWRWSLLTGALGIATLTALTYALGRLMPLELDFPEALETLPPVTLATLVVMISVMAGMVEEAAFRGYMQSRIERRHGPVVAIAVVSVLFAQAHFPASIAAMPRMGLIVPGLRRLRHPGFRHRLDPARSGSSMPPETSSASPCFGTHGTPPPEPRPRALEDWTTPCSGSMVSKLWLSAS